MAQHVIQGPEQTALAEIRFGAVLAGRQYDMTLTWIPCASFWTFEMALEGENLIAGVHVPANLDMLQPYADSRMPPGQLIAHDTEGKQEAPGRDDWRERHRLVYVDPEDPAPTVDIKVTRIFVPT